MEYCYSKKPLLTFLVLCCFLLLPLASSVPMSRSLCLRNQQHPPSLKLPAQEITMVAKRNLGRATVRMDVEVNDYPMPGANDSHEPPKGPGRA